MLPFASTGLRPHDSSHHRKADTGRNRSHLALAPRTRVSRLARARANAATTISHRERQRDTEFTEKAAVPCGRGAALRAADGGGTGGYEPPDDRQWLVPARPSHRPEGRPNGRPPRTHGWRPLPQLSWLQRLARTRSSTTHHPGALRLIRAVRAIRGSRSVWLRSVAADAFRLTGSYGFHQFANGRCD